MDADSLPRVAFVHVPKTAGTSVTEVLCLQYLDMTFPGVTTIDYQAASDQELQHYMLFKGHMYADDYRRLDFRVKKFTILRNPVDRATSLYYYYKSINLEKIDDSYTREAIHNAKTRSIIEFLYSASPVVIEHVRFGQIRQFLSRETLADLAHRQFVSDSLKNKMVQEFKVEMDLFEACLTVEMLHWSFPLLIEEFGLNSEVARLPLLNLSAREESEEPERVLRAVVDVSDIEFICYEYVRRKEIDFLRKYLVNRGVNDIV
jgi:hypothetical protein